MKEQTKHTEECTQHALQNHEGPAPETNAMIATTAGTCTQ
jgi:hypothetical protein